jgi:hypothetical protein
MVAVVCNAARLISDYGKPSDPATFEQLRKKEGAS